MMKEFFKQHFGNPEEAFRGQLDEVELDKIITLHPLKDPAYMTRIHLQFLTHTMAQLNKKKLKLYRVLEKLKRLGKNQTPESSSSSLYPKESQHSRLWNSPQPWEFFDFSKVWALNENPPLRYIHYSTEVATKKAVGFAKETLLRKAEASLFHNVNFGKYHRGYMRVDPTKGLEYVIDMPTKYRSLWEGKVRVSQTRHLLYLRQNFGEFTYSQVETVDRKQILHFILPLMGRLEMFKMFLASFEKEFLIPKEAVKLLAIYFPDAASPVKQKKEFQYYAKKYPSVMTWVNFRGPFKKAAALQMGVNYFNNDSLLLLCDVDVVFRREFVNRCRETAILDKRAYFPIVFSEFNPNITYAGKQGPGTHYHYTKEAGIWRVHGFGLVCAYAQDINHSGGLKTELAGWGMEDVDLYAKFVQNDDIEVFRAPDLGLVHVYHPHVACANDSTEENRAMCRSAQADRYVSASSAIDFFNLRGYLRTLTTGNFTSVVF